MREIKFRAWDKGARIMDYKIKSIDFEKQEILFAIIPFKLSEVILEQYTGLKDKNGKEIYEGDIRACLYDDHCNCKKVIMWSDDGARFYLKTIGKCKQEFVVQTIWDMRKKKHLGNIHENPELLESKGGV